MDKCAEKLATKRHKRKLATDFTDCTEFVLPRRAQRSQRHLASRASSSKSFFEASFYKSLFSATRPSVDGRLKLSRLAKLVGRGSNDEFDVDGLGNFGRKK